MSIYQQLYNLDNKRKWYIKLFNGLEVAKILESIDFEYINPKTDYNEEGCNLFEMYYKTIFIGLFHYESILNDLIALAKIIEYLTPLENAIQHFTR